MPHYHAITIGPIYDTLKQARKTRELWGASYIFSVLMRELVKAKPGNWTLLSPTIHVTSVQNGAGLYPDRAFFETDQEVTKKEMDDLVDTALKEVGKLLKIPGNLIVPLFRIYAARITDPGESAIMTLNRLLDILELQPYIPDGSTGLPEYIDEEISKIQDDGGGNAAFVLFSGQKRLPSIPEIAFNELKGEPDYKTFIEGPANQSVLDYQEKKKKGKKLTREERKIEAQQEDENIVNFKKALQGKFKFRHKYLCFVQADGDNVGKSLAALGNNPAVIGAFSQKLAEFGQHAVNFIAEFGGLPIYAGGDDLLFLSPVQNSAQEHVFDLIRNLGESFEALELEKLAKSVNPQFGFKPALSFGMSISYIKYPMFESLDVMTDLLLNKAKEHPGKNALAFRVLKHSGHAFGCTVGKNGQAFTKAVDLIKLCRGQDVNFLTSVMHKIFELKPMLEDAIANERGEYFFKHHFNERAHARSMEEKYISEVRELAEVLHAENTPIAETLFPILRFVQFLNQDDHE